MGGDGGGAGLVTGMIFGGDGRGGAGLVTGMTFGGDGRGGAGLVRNGWKRTLFGG